jgi:hypothetical protein
MIWEEHIKNRNELPQAELEKYYGQHVAWSMDGKRILAGGADDLEVFEAVKAAGYDSQQVVFSYVPFPNEILMGGALLFNEEVDS